MRKGERRDSEKGCCPCTCTAKNSTLFILFLSRHSLLFESCNLFCSPSALQWNPSATSHSSSVLIFHHSRCCSKCRSHMHEWEGIRTFVQLVSSSSSHLLRKRGVRNLSISLNCSTPIIDPHPLRWRGYYVAIAIATDAWCDDSFFPKPNAQDPCICLPSLSVSCV